MTTTSGRQTSSTQLSALDPAKVFTWFAVPREGTFFHSSRFCSYH
jgi:hypothetical protein